mmetsp:Transcript_23326/g.29412  ORF Transcript_23326/g.29412 Transcript_23326/m.29412 type:complete len:204 (-) Transcript_23326:268-879(-)
MARSFSCLCASIASRHNFFSSSSFTRISSSRLASAALSSSIRFCSASIRSLSSFIIADRAESMSECPSALVSAPRAFSAASLISSNCTFSATFFNSGTRSGPKGATAVGVSTRRLMFSTTRQVDLLFTANLSFSPRARTGHKIASVDASTVATKVVDLSSSIALTVSFGLQMAFTTAGIAGATSGLILVLQHARSALFAAIVT